MIRVLHVVSTISISSGVMSMIMNYYRKDTHGKLKFGFIYWEDSLNTYEQEISDLGGTVYKICSPTNMIKFIDEAQRIIPTIRNQYDIIHMHNFFTPVLYKFIQLRAGIPRMIVHAHVTKYSNGGVLRSIRNKLFELPNRFCVDRYFAASYEAGHAIFGHRFDKNGEVIRNAIDLGKYCPNKENRDFVRRSLGVDKKYVIGHVGNFYPPKNHHFIIDVFRELLKIKNDAVLVLVGDGPEFEEIKHYSKDLQEKIVFVGLCTDPEGYYRAFDKFIFPSRFEGLGLAMIEAQACGIPCVFADTIPKESNIFPESNTKLSLSDEKEKWSRALLVETKLDENEIYKKITLAGFNMDEAFDTLCEAYKSIL